MDNWMFLFLGTVCVIFNLGDQSILPNSQSYEGTIESCIISDDDYKRILSIGKFEAEQWLQLNESFSLLKLHEQCDCEADSSVEFYFAITCSNVDVFEAAPTVPFGLTYLRIDNFTETLLNRNVLSRLGTTMTTLKLEDGKLTHVTSTFFEGLINLEILSLKNNNLHTLNFNLFQHNPLVEEFDISENYIVSTQEFCNATRFWKNFKYLDISSNPLQINDNAFAYENSTIDFLDISDCGLETIGVNAFSSLISLKHLVVRYNPLISEALFNMTESLRNISLERLEMEYLIRLTRIPTKALGNLANITQLEMRLGQYLELHEYAFPRLMNLKDIDLSSCRIQSIHANAFIRVPNLEKLNLAYNQLSSSSGVTKLPNLKFLNLEKNNFRRMDLEIKKNQLSQLVNLREVSFAGSKLHLKLSNGIFDGLFLLDDLNLQKTGLAYIDEYVFQDLTNLKTLDLTQNWLCKLDSNIFYGLRNLHLLIISYNKISLNFDQQNPLRHLKAVEYIFLRGNKISVLPINLFSELNYLRAVKLQNNLIETWDYPVFPRGKQLRVIDLKNNKITSVSSQMLDEFSTLEKLSLEGNPLKCVDCDIQKYQSWVTENREILQNPLKEECFINDTTKINIFNVSTSELKCHKGARYFRKYFIVIVVALVFTGLTAYTCYLGRWYVRYIVVRLGIKLLKREEKCQQNFQFDAFISYSNEDSEWVLQNLLPNVEIRSIKLCLHQRDFQVGIPITDNVIMAIERSRKTVLIVSKNYVQSVWCLLEAQLAQITLKDAKRNGIVVVLLQDVPRKHMPNNMRQLLETRTYISAPVIKVEDNIFYEKIIKAIEMKL